MNRHSTANPDAATLAACAAFDRGDDQLHLAVEANDETPAGVDRQSAADEVRRAAGHALAEAEPMTLAGHAARAASALRSAARFDSDDPENALRYLPAGLVLAILADLAAEAGGDAPAFGKPEGLIVSQPPADHAHPDVQLLADCAAFETLEWQYVAASRNDGADIGSIVEAQSPLVGRISAARPVTPDGAAARARSLILYAPDMVGEAADGDTGQTLLRAILRDLAGSEAVAAAQYPRTAPAGEGMR